MSYQCVVRPFHCKMSQQAIKARTLTESVSGPSSKSNNTVIDSKECIDTLMSDTQCVRNDNYRYCHKSLNIENIICNIFTYLHFQSLLYCGLVNKQF